MRLAVNQSCFPGISTAQFVEATISAGLSSVELRAVDQSESMDAMASAVRGRGLVVEAVNALTDWALPDDPDPMPRFHEMLDLAVAVSAPLIICVAPIRHGSLPAADRIAEWAAERLATFSAVARKEGVFLALEQIGQSSSRPGAQSGLRGLSDALRISQGAAPDVRLVVDTYNLATAGEQFPTIFALPLDRIGIAHIADVNERTGLRDFPGRGHLDLTGFVRILQAAGFQGALSLEFFPPTPWPRPKAFAAEAASVLRRLTGGHDLSGAPTNPAQGA